MEGPETFHRFVVIEFPTLEQGVKCFESPEYQEAAQLPPHRRRHCRARDRRRRRRDEIDSVLRRAIRFMRGQGAPSGTLPGHKRVAKTLDGDLIDNRTFCSRGQHLQLLRNPSTAFCWSR